MIIGNGDIASVLKNREDRVYFASGVSNSHETRRSEYEREKTLLLVQNTHRHLVYFSSLSVFYSDTLYAQHKLRMERLVRQYFKKYTILRIGNIAWGKNPDTFINNFKNLLEKGKKPQIWPVVRYIVSKEEFLYWIDLIPNWSCEMNIPGRKTTPEGIINEIQEGKL